MRPSRFLSLWLLVVCLRPSIPCHAQDAASTLGEVNAADAAGEATAPEAVPPAEIAAQAGEVTSQLQQIEADIQPSATIAQLAIEFSKQAQTIAELRGELADLNVATASARRLAEQRREWVQLAEQIDRWTQVADQRWRSLQQTREELRAIQQRWELTREAAAQEELPPEVLRRVEQIIERVGSVQAAIRPRIDQLAEVTERLADARQTTDEAFNQLADLTERVNQRLLRRDSAPLWNTPGTQWLQLDESTRAAARRWSRDLQVFASDYWARLLVQLLIFAALAAAAVQARQASGDWPKDEPELERARFLLSRPFSLALAFAIPAALFLYDVLPAAARDLFYLVLLLPMLRLARGLTSATERIAMYGLFALSGLYQLAYLSTDGLLSRLALLVVEVAAVAVVGHVLWRGRATKRREYTRRRSATMTIFTVVLLMFVVSLLANLFGWVNLSQFLTEATLLTCQGAILAILLCRAGAALWLATLRHEWGRRLLSIRRHPQLYERVGIHLLALALFSYWLLQTLRRFRLSETVATRVEEFLARPFSWADMQLTFGDVCKTLAILTATFVAQRVLSFLLREELFPRLSMRTSSGVIFATLLKYAIVAVGLGMAGSALGFTGTQLTVLFGALGVGIGLGLQSIVNNFVSGLILMFERPVKIGDIVELGGVWGTVKHIGVRATVVQAFEGSELVVPNGDLISKEVKNWTLSGTSSRVEVVVGTAYSSDPREVLRILSRVAGEHEFVFSEPAPLAMMFGFGESSLSFRMFCWTSIEQRATVISDLHVAVHEVLRDADIEIPFPQRDLHVHSVSASAFDLARLTRAE